MGTGSVRFKNLIQANPQVENTNLLHLNFKFYFRLLESVSRVATPRKNCLTHIPNPFLFVRIQNKFKFNTFTGKTRRIHRLEVMSVIRRKQNKRRPNKKEEDRFTYKNNKQIQLIHNFTNSIYSHIHGDGEKKR